MNLIPLSPRYLFVFKKSSSASTFRYLDMNHNMIDTVNKLIAMNSRYWIVLNNKHNIKKYIGVFKDVKPDYKPVLREIKHLTAGYNL